MAEVESPGPEDYNYQTLYSSFAHSEDLLSGQLDVPHGWLAQIARVRPRIEPLQQTLSLADLVLPDSSVSASNGYSSLKVGQMPFDETDNPDWVATGTAPDSSNAVSWLIVDAEGVVDDIKDNFEQGGPTPRRLAGLIVDEWNEVIPSDEETTSVSFHYDRPTAQAPQSVLLAVPPVVEAGEEWTDEMLTNIVLDTMELARLRGVDSALLGEWLQLVPTLVFPDYAASNKPTITTDFSSYL